MQLPVIHPNSYLLGVLSTLAVVILVVPLTRDGLSLGLALGVPVALLTERVVIHWAIPDIIVPALRGRRRHRHADR